MCFVLSPLYVLILSFEIILEEVRLDFWIGVVMERDWAGSFGFLIISREWNLNFSLLS